MQSAMNTVVIALLAVALPVHAVVFKSCGTADVSLFTFVNCTETSKFADPEMENTPGGVCYEPGLMKSMSVTGSGCITTLWTQPECKGENYIVMDSSCITRDFQSVSVYC
jgi:hypothetical protein